MANLKLLLIGITVGLLVASSARASCGDYVTWKGKKKEAPSTSPGDPMTMPAEHMPDKHGSPFKPCNGPGCSNGKLPPLAPVSPRLVESDQWAWDMTGLSQSHPESALFLISSDPTEPAHQTAKVFHPPR